MSPRGSRTVSATVEIELEAPDEHPLRVWIEPWGESPRSGIARQPPRSSGWHVAFCDVVEEVLDDLATVEIVQPLFRHPYLVSTFDRCRGLSPAADEVVEPAVDYVLADSAPAQVCARMASTAAEHSIRATARRVSTRLCERAGMSPEAQARV